MALDPISKGISAKFANMGFVCACLVVLMHVHSPWEGGGISKIAVPFFFVTSGYFLAGKPWCHEVAKRIRTLLLPLFFWCVVWALVTIPLAIALNFHAGRPMTANLLWGWSSLRYVALDPFHQPAMGPLWYLRCLFLFVLFSPVLTYGIQKAGVLVPLALAAFYFLFPQSWHLEKLFVFGLSIEGLFYFSCGLWLKLKSVSLELNVLAGWVILIAGFLMFVFVYQAMAIPFVIVGLWGVMPARRFPEFMVSNAFPIYLIHTFVLLFFGHSRIVSVFLALVVWVATLILSLLAAMFFRHLLPRLASFAFGGR